MRSNDVSVCYCAEYQFDQGENTEQGESSNVCIWQKITLRCTAIPRRSSTQKKRKKEKKRKEKDYANTFRTMTSIEIRLNECIPYKYFGCALCIFHRFEMPRRFSFFAVLNILPCVFIESGDDGTVCVFWKRHPTHRHNTHS